MGQPMGATFTWPLEIVATLTQTNIIRINGDLVTAMSGNEYKVLQRDDQEITLREHKIVYKLET